MKKLLWTVLIILFVGGFSTPVFATGNGKEYKKSHDVKISKYWKKRIRRHNFWRSRCNGATRHWWHKPGKCVKKDRDASSYGKWRKSDDDEVKETSLDIYSMKKKYSGS